MNEWTHHLVIPPGINMRHMPGAPKQRGRSKARVVREYEHDELGSRVVVEHDDGIRVDMKLAEFIHAYQWNYNQEVTDG